MKLENVAMAQSSSNLATVLERDAGVDLNYRHAPKHATPGENIEPRGAVPKWYAVHPEDQPLPDELTQLARSYLMRNDLEAKGGTNKKRGNDF